MATRRHILSLGLGLPALLAGCGWEPLLANHETDPVNEQLSAIRVDPIADRVGQRLEFALRESLNPTNAATPKTYRLSVTYGTSLKSLGISSQGLGTRGEVGANATFLLTDMTSGEGLLKDTVEITDSFDIQANGYSTVVAQQDAVARCSEEVRREIVTRLTLFLQNRKATASS
jgi:hypothetical protein